MPMSPVAGPFFAAALLLGLAGVLKVVTPGPTRVALRSAGLPSTALAARAIGTVEVAIAVCALGWGGRLARRAGRRSPTSASPGSAPG